MSTVLSPTDVREAALSLPEPERADLAYGLILSLKPAGLLEEGTEEFAMELERRVQAYEAGETVAEEWETVLNRIRRELAGHRPS
jgi:putative addiction module component (TIGR02574 family)